ncbi:LOW QUALITY PROTEIN: TBC1 domain family member 5 [Thrips palmi]|uniref:LOW QUALITY PROTEIN: TBC1 domain family member 5 n=1 Tax=Thrips palmi TaxID=161013 RepID=A0A6P8ZHB9_THRPL|nr:LOW QUALITY PROTEIN: TBC1 domain family member 5 [Thrips palmi]
MSDEEGDALSVMLGNGDSEKKNSDVNNVTRKYSDEWSELCILADKGLPELKKHAVSMRLQGSRLRSIYWQLLLGSLPTTPSLWISILRQQRNSYRLLHQRLTVNPHRDNVNVDVDNPLSQSCVSVWHQYFCDKELRALIRQDVVRTFPKMDFFRSESIQLTMVNILFCYAREHAEICYRQGMHEVLAPLLYVMHSDQQFLVRARESAAVSEKAAEILDPAWLEEDAYWLFSQLMTHLAGSYRVKNVTPLTTGHFPSSLGKSNGHASHVGAETELAMRLNHIKGELLACFDKELHQHLKILDIPFQTFGIRWLRLMFAQEFPLDDLMYLWDAVFAEGDDLVNYIVVSMLIAIRDQLLVEDDTECLMLLMRYPSGIDVKTIVENALHMLKPKKYASLMQGTAQKEPMESSVIQKKMTSQPSTISRFKRLSLWSQKKDATPVSRPYPTSVHSPPEKSAARLDKPDSMNSVVEGFTLHDPMVAKAELEHLHHLITLVHAHLERYHATLERTLPSNTPAAGRAALDGIKRLSVQLRRSIPSSSRSIEVETASEAQPLPRSGTMGEVGNIPIESSGRNTNKEASKELTELNIHNRQETSTCFPLINPLSLQSSQRDDSRHVYFCRELGADLVEKLGTLKI